MAEWVVLDPEEVAEGRVELDITPFVNRDGIDWGDAAVTAYMADAQRGSLPIDFTMPNRQVTIPLLLLDRAEIDDDNANNFDAIRSAVQAKASLFQREGGWIKRSVAGDPVYAEVVGATLKLSGNTAQAISSIDADAVLTLELVPDFFADEETLTEDPAGSSATGEVVTVLENIDGHHPARTRIVVTEEGAAAQLGLIYALRSRHYSAAPTAACAYAAQDLTPLDAAADATVDSEPVVRHQNLSTAWTPVLGLSSMTHTGTNRLWAIVHSTSATPPRLRAVYDVGDMVLPEENDPVAIPGASNFYLVDLGELRLDRGPVGDHKWAGQIQAIGAAGGENVSILRVYVLNCDEGYGVIRASVTAEPGLADYTARDEFNQSAGALAGQTLPTGGTWSGAGDSADFAVEATGKTAERTAVSDASIEAGRFAIAGSEVLTDTAVQVDSKVSAGTGGNPSLGVLARYTDINNWLIVGIVRSAPPADSNLFIHKRVAGTVTPHANAVNLGPIDRDVMWRVRTAVLATGQLLVWAGPAAAAHLGDPIYMETDPDLATGGDLEDGKVGIYDSLLVGSAHTRNYDNFAAWAPAIDAVLNSGRALEIRTDGAFREIASGTDWGPTQPPYGDLPRLPPSGLEGRPCEVFLLASSGDLDQLPHAAGDLSARVYSRASYLTAPPGPPFPSEDTIPSPDLIP